MGRFIIGVIVGIVVILYVLVQCVGNIL